ncbi:hypothetical protein MAPG_00480 [Magnaporthiopsis poae ATCC 64411]|uniref:Mid2 domain-containing protein n=1 Tax=Magnaporthiopsis poae (strain ATCC 64411 / 73-15) TaxID=644358 RepID=A0A0C4DL43_MAGP6|nr:hypothetical protein MAPG_00480 [Magnaporthiopsis poae ATCC 64411]
MSSRLPMSDDIFRRLPRATALLILSALVEFAQPSALPRATTTLPYMVLDVVAWPPLPTAPARTPNEIHELRRRQDANTICGYIGGDPNLPATCSAGSHCVLDRQHNVVGCCPNGQPTCSTGVFTGCVDRNSGPQTVVNPYVFTCQGSDVCYKNVFGGGLSQYGCGTASSLGTTVMASASGVTDTVSLTSIQVSFTESLSTLSTPTTISSPSTTSTSASSSSTSTTSSSSSTSSTSSSTSTSTSGTASSPAQTTSAVPAAGAGGSGNSRSDKTGAIVGGAISGVAVLIALIAVAIFFWRRRAASNVRKGPGPNGNTQYVSPMTGAHGFQRLHDSNAAYEAGMPPGAVSALPPAAAMYQQPQQQQGWQQEMAQQQALREAQGQQQAQKWPMDANAQVGVNENSGTVRYVEGDPTAAQAGPGNVAFVESMPDGSGYSGNPQSAAAAVTAAGGLGGSTGITSPTRPGSVAQAPPAHGYHYPGQYTAAYAGAPVAAAAVAGGAAAAMDANRGVSHGATSSYGGASSYYTNSYMPPPPTSPPSGPVPPPPSSTYGDSSVSSVSRGMSIRGGGGSSARISHPTPIANQFTSAAWAVQMRGSQRESSDDYGRGYPDGLERIGEDEPLTTSMQDNPVSNNGATGLDSSTQPEGGGGLVSKDSLMSRVSGSSDASSNGGRPLWHQNRLHSRNQMWM